MSYELKKQDIYDFARAMNADTKEKGDELFFKFCPYCNGGDNKDKETFSINLVKGIYHCFRSGCGADGHFVELCRDFNYPIPGMTPVEYRILPQPTKPYEPDQPAIEYLKTRGISKSVAEKYEITTQDGKPSLLVFPFYDEEGYLASIKYRNTKFRKGIDKNKEWFEPGTEPILFGMKQCKDFSRLIITEGQMDSLSLAEAGLDNAVSVPTGATAMKWFERCREWMQRFEEIVVFGDCEKGKITLIDYISDSLSNSNIKCVRYIDYLGEKDANDILVRYGKHALVKAIDKAERIESDSIDTADYLKTQLFDSVKDAERYKSIKTGFKTLDKKLNGLHPGVYMVGGVSSAGKSSFMWQLADNLAQTGRNVVYISLEQTKFEMATKSLARLSFTEKGNSLLLGTPFSSIAIRDDLAIKGTVESLIQMYGNRKKGKLEIIEGMFGKTFEDVEQIIIDRVDRAKTPEQIPIIIIDYLQTLLSSDNKMGGNARLETDFYAKGFEKLAKRKGHETTIFVVSAFNRTSYNLPVAYESFKESGGLEFTADVIMGLQYRAIYRDDVAAGDTNRQKKELAKLIRDEETRREDGTGHLCRDMRLSVLKNRFGEKQFDIDFKYYCEYDYFEDVGTIDFTEGFKKSDNTPGENKSDKARKLEAMYQNMKRDVN